MPGLPPAAVAARLAGARDRSRLRSVVLDLLPEMLAAPAAGWYLLGWDGTRVEAEVRSAPDAFPWTGCRRGRPRRGGRATRSPIG
jgi:hypothetical protein